MVNRREFLHGVGVVAITHSYLDQIAQALGFPPQAGAQIAGNSLEVKAQGADLHHSGDVIKDPATTIYVEGWNVLYETDGIFEYERKIGKSVDVRLDARIPNSEPIGLFSNGYDFSHKKNGRSRRDFRPLPSQDNDIANLVISETENGHVTQRTYNVALDFHTFKTPNDGLRRVFAETPLESSLLAGAHELHALFGKLTNEYALPKIYVHNIQDETVRSVQSGELAIQVPSIVLTQPKFVNEGFIRIYRQLAEHLVMRVEFDEEPRFKAQLYDAHKALMTAAGFNGEKYFGRQAKDEKDNEKVRSEAEAYASQLASNPLVRIFDLFSRMNYPGTAELDLYNHGIYFSYQGLFASSLAGFNFFPNEFLRDFGRLKPEEQKAVALVGNSALDYLESLTKGGVRTRQPQGQFTPEPAIVGVLPHYQMLRREFKQN